MIQNGEFRQDLFYRLNVMPINLSPLRERADDIPALVSHFIEKFNKLHNREISGIETDAMTSLKKYSWPGNIRELENAIERAFVMELGQKVRLRSLPEHITGLSAEYLDDIEETVEDAMLKTAHDDESFSLNISGIDFQHEKEEFERQFIINALKRFGGRINQTVAHANIPKNTLLRKIRKYEIKPHEYDCGEEHFKEHDMHPDETI